jgi:hypothetical protein
MTKALGRLLVEVPFLFVVGYFLEAPQDCLTTT